MLARIPASKQALLRCAFSTSAPFSAPASGSRMDLLFLDIPEALRININTEIAAKKDAPKNLSKWALPKASNPPRKNDSNSTESPKSGQYKGSPHNASSGSSSPRTYRTDGPRQPRHNTSGASSETRGPRPPREDGDAPRRTRESRYTNDSRNNAAPRDGDSSRPRYDRGNGKDGERMRRVAVVQDDGTVGYTFEPYGAKRVRNDGEAKKGDRERRKGKFVAGDKEGRDRSRGRKEVEAEGLGEKAVELAEGVKEVVKDVAHVVKDVAGSAEQVVARSLAGGMSLLGLKRPAAMEEKVDVETGEKSESESSVSGQKWDGGKAARAKASLPPSYRTFLPSLPLSDASATPTESALAQLKWVLGKNPSVSQRQQGVAVKMVEQRYLGGGKGSEKRA